MVAAAVVAGALGWAAPAGAAPAVEVVAVASAQDTATLVVAVRPPPTLSRPGVFRVEGEDGRALGVDTHAVLSPQVSTGVVVDTSTAGAGALQGGINGASSFLLQLPDGVSSTVVGDGGAAPTTLSPLTQGATTAIGALNGARPGGDRHPGAALATALAGLPARTGVPRLLLLYTGAPDAAGPSAAELTRTLREAGVLLAVVATGTDQRYWSEVAGATGGVLVSARGPAPRTAFDRVARMLRERFVLTVPRPAELPATVDLSVRVGTETTTEAVVLPADTAGSAPPGPGDEDRSGSAVPWWVLGALLTVAAVAGAALLARRWSTPTPATPPAGGPDEITGPAPRTRPAAATPVAPGHPAAATAGSPPPDRSTRPAPLPRRTAGATRTDPGRPGGPPPPDGTADVPAPRSPADEPSQLARRVPPEARQDPSPSVPGHPAADRRAYGRLDDETGRVASLVAEGRLDTGRAVARIALAAPGRVDLLDRVVDVERRLAGAALGASAPSDTVLGLLAAARRVVTGEVALVGPGGVRVTQVPGAQVFTVARPGRTTEQVRGTTDLGRRVDLAALTAPTPTADRATS